MISKIHKLFSIFILFFLFGIFSHTQTLAVSTTDTADIDLSVYQNTPIVFEGQVTKIIEEKPFQINEEKHLSQKLEIAGISGPFKNQYIIVNSGDIPLVSTPKYKVGDRLVLNYIQGPDSQDNFYIADYVRRGELLRLFLIFIFITVLIGRFRGFMSLLGMAISFLVIFKFILPQILLGRDPVLISIIGSIVIIPVTFILSHGANKKTFVAMFSTLISLVITGIMAAIFVGLTRLTGFSSEEASYLQISEATINIRGLLLAGIIIGGLGVFDDVTISQAAIVAELKDTSKKMGIWELYTRAMNIGRDHIASVVNTLVLVYTGAAMPLLLLFFNSSHPFSEIINYEIIAEEIVRTLVVSIGLILSVPITTFMAAYFFNKSQKNI